MTTIRAILTAARGYVATLPTARSGAALFKEHVTNLPFETTPVAGADGFEIIEVEDTLTQGFGQDQVKEGQFFMLLKLGHAPWSIDKERDNLVADDVENLADKLERFVWPVGTMAVWYEGRTTDKSLSNWWITTMRFRIVYRGVVL